MSIEYYNGGSPLILEDISIISEGPVPEQGTWPSGIYFGNGSGGVLSHVPS